MTVSKKSTDLHGILHSHLPPTTTALNDGFKKERTKNSVAMEYNNKEHLLLKGQTKLLKIFFHPASPLH
jgi:hypothetical protein